MCECVCERATRMILVGNAEYMRTAILHVAIEFLPMPERTRRCTDMSKRWVTSQTAEIETSLEEVPVEQVEQEKKGKVLVVDRER